MLSIKDSASFIHTLLHYMPNNPWHHHTIHQHRINPMEIHKHLQHSHEHSHEHTHAHDLEDHLGTGDDSQQKSSLPPIKLDLKIDLFIQADPDFTIQQCIKSIRTRFYSFYLFTSITHFPFPPFQPPQQASYIAGQMYL